MDGNGRWHGDLPSKPHAVFNNRKTGGWLVVDRLVPGQHLLPGLPPRRAPVTAEDKADAEHETEVIPVSAVVHITHVDVVGKQRNDESNR